MKTISLSELENLKANLPLSNCNEKAYEINSYFIFFTRKSSNTYENLRIVVFYIYNDEEYKIPFYGRLDANEMKEFCSKFNAPRAPFKKRITEKEFYKIADQIGCGKLNSEIIEGQIKSSIKNEIRS